VARLYISEPPVKLTPEQCAQLLGQLSAIIGMDDVAAGPEAVSYLRGCGVVIASSRPVLGRHGVSRTLAGLPDETAPALLASELGRPFTSAEEPAAARLVAAVDGQPLHLRQAAALAGGRPGTRP
jgi:hypothetical protein